MKGVHCLLVFFALAISSYGQKVGLVLSGGAAKGIAHVGVLKALEENNIPIDYIVGTSMGGIIGGAYAAGYSPDQIEHIVLSEEFLRWVNGLPETGFNYYYHENEIDPHFIKVNLSLDSILNFQLNASIASDVSLNFALAEQMAQASAISNYNFDSLFVPLRVVAADIFTQNQVTLSKGFLSDALRATQTVPFFYNPIRVDGKYLFDGGVYNNFPVDIAESNFQPDVIIGSNVSAKIYNDYPYDLDDKLISNSLLFLLLDKSDPASVPVNGVYIQPNLQGYTAFDFVRAKAMIDSGYVQTLRQIEEIKKKVGVERTCDEVTDRRNNFNNQNPPLLFNKLSFKGFTPRQQRYLRHIFHFKKHDENNLSFGEIKRSYFRLVSEEYFNTVYPNILFDSATRQFEFQLTRRPQKNFQVDFGGVIATRDISSIFLGLNFYNFQKRLLHVYSGFNTGNFYKSAIVKGRFDFPFRMFIEPVLQFDSWDYLQSDDLLISTLSPTVVKRINRRYGIHVGWPLGNFFKSAVSVSGINNTDNYGNRSVLVSSDTLDILKLSGYKAEISFKSNTLNRKQYPSSGSAYSIRGQFFNVDEIFRPGNTSFDEGRIFKPHHWVRIRARAEQYFDAGWFKPGYVVEGTLSNQRGFTNYKGTVINTPAFFPLQDSRTLLLENFRAFNYVAAGSRNVFRIRKRLDFRLEGYLFKPIQQLYEGPEQQAVTKADLKLLYFAGTAGLVLHSPMGPIALNVNYYDDAQNRLGVLLHVGYLLFNDHSLE